MFRGERAPALAVPRRHDTELAHVPRFSPWRAASLRVKSRARAAHWCRSPQAAGRGDSNEPLLQLAFSVPSRFIGIGRGTDSGAAVRGGRARDVWRGSGLDRSAAMEGGSASTYEAK